jgi:tRNA nucleotidyltransferase (CCA-adding enzyme)
LRSDLLDALRRYPGGESLLAVATEDVYLVGGAVRDLLLAETGMLAEMGMRAEGECLPASVAAPRELDVVVDSVDAPLGAAAARLADALAARLGVPGGAVGHERFGTVLLEWEGGSIDIATARRERYPAPGALPEVQPAPLAEDLRRRDFTVNALAVGLGGAQQGEVTAVEHAREDLAAGLLRVLHERSFRDDPTRLWRLARYRARLGFAVEEGTATLAAAAVAEGALATVSGARVGAELRLALAELDPLAALAEADRLGLLGALHPRLRFEAPLARRALALLGAGGGPADGDSGGVLLLAALALPLALRADGGVGGHPSPEIAALLDRLEFAAGERDRVAAACAAVPSLIDELPRAHSASQLRTLALSVPPEGVALAGAVSEPAAPAARRWLGEARHVRLLINGADLLAAGVPEGPEVGRRLEAVLRAKLDGALSGQADGRAAELVVALEAE